MACFYAVQALFITHGIDAFTHKGSKQMLGLHFIQTGLLSKNLGVLYNQLFNARSSGDYEDFVYFTKDSLDLFRPASEEFISAIEKLVREQPAIEGFSIG
jgi:uncharacterized protein (UPF0332 family)